MAVFNETVVKDISLQILIFISFEIGIYLIKCMAVGACDVYLFVLAAVCSVIQLYCHSHVTVPILLAVFLCIC